MPTDHHLDDNAVLAYVEHRIADGARREIEQHLDSCPRCLSLTCAVAGSAGDVDRGDWRSAPAVAGRYELVEMIGQGAMGSVYAARDPQLDRNVAIKIIRSDRFSDPAVRTRLSREARTMAQVTHPNVVAVYDAGELDGGVYIVMELRSGTTLATWRETKPTWRDTMRVFLLAGRGLAAAHAAGIVHRDFKPANVMLDDSSRVAVADFGLAETEGEVLHGIAGTPRYMSPEQLAGAEVDARSDQFSFAVALREALDGAPPSVYRVIDRALSPVAAQRFASMEVLLAALEQTSRPPRRRWLVIVAGTLALGLIAAAVVLARRAEPVVLAPAAPRQRPSVFVGPFENRTGDPELADTLDLLVGDALAHSTAVDVYAGANLMAAALGLDGDVHDLDALASKAHAASGKEIWTVRGAVTRSGDRYIVQLTSFVGAIGVVYVGVSRTKPRLAVDVTSLGATLAERWGPLESTPHPSTTSLTAMHAYAMAQAAMVAGDVRAAEPLVRAALAADPTFAKAHQVLGMALGNLSAKAPAAAAMELAIKYADHMPERERLTLLGDHAGTTGRYAEAIAAYQQLLSRWPGDARTEINATATAIEAQSFPLALDLARRAFASHPEIGVVVGNLLVAEVATNHFAEAIRDGEVMVAKGKPTAFALSALAIAHAMSNNLARARAVIDTMPPDEHALHASALADLAAFTGKRAEAIQIMRAYIAAHAADGEDALRASWITLANLQFLDGNVTEAAASAARAIGEGSFRLEYFAARLRLEAGDPVRATTLATEWVSADLPEPRTYGHLLRADLALHAGDPSAALAEVTEASHHGPSWLTHERRARALLAAGQDATQDLAWLRDHHGEIAVFMTPSLALLRFVEALERR